MPYPTRLNPHLDTARERLMTWGRQMGMLDPAPGVAHGALWSEHDLRTFDFALCAAGLDPDAALTELDLASGWLCRGTYGDDYYPAVFGRNRDLAGAKAQNERLLACMPVDCAAIPAPANPQETGLADLWARTTLGSPMTMALARIAHGQQVPPEIYQTRTIQSLENTASDYACLLNDVSPTRRRYSSKARCTTASWSCRTLFGCGAEQAAEIVNDLMTARMRQFERVVTTELPALCEQYQLGGQARKILDQRAAELQDWMAGILNWHTHCGRYREAELLRRYRPAAVPAIDAPTGLGTSPTPSTAG